MTSPSNRQDKVSVIRDFPHGCGISKKEVESADLLMKKKVDFNIDSNSNFGSRIFVSSKMKFPPSCGSKVKPLSIEESFELLASQSRRSQQPESFDNIQRKSFPLEKKRNLPKMKEKKLSNAFEPRNEGHSNQGGLIPVMQRNKITKVLSTREKVLKALSLFNLFIQELDHEESVQQGESKGAKSRNILTILKNNGKQVNNKKMIGPVPGIEIGQEFQFKSVLNLIGLHFNLMGGIDYMNRGDMILATSIVSSEGNGYNDIFDSDMLIYNGQGAYTAGKDRNVMEDQKLVKGNLSLANSMREKTPVRVIRGKKRLDHRGKHYVYVGLYLVHDYWQERAPGGNIVYKFKLGRIMVNHI